MSITCVSEFPCAPGKIDELIKIFHEALPLARGISGCEKIYFSISESAPYVAVTFAPWNSTLHHDKYLPQLTANRPLSDIHLCLIVFSNCNFFNNFSYVNAIHKLN